ncbi:MAG: hypothetical protein HYX80_10635 [Chloroflexi bacterium]|nr:hypothetical protein [Chloroflexota bacterium]
MVRNRMDIAAARLPENWAQMTPAQKRQYKLDGYLSTEGKNFVSPEAEKAYKLRAKRMVDVLNIEEPDTVPVNLPVGNLPLTMAGLKPYASFYEYEKVAEAYMKFNEKYEEELEYFAAPAFTSGRIMELLDYKLYSWPGYGLPEDASGHQYIEGEYMMADEYDALIHDPTDFWLRTYLPRVFGTFEAFRMFQPFTIITEIVHFGQLAPLGTPAGQGMLKRLLEVGEEFQTNAQMTAKYAGMGVSHGFPVMGSIFCKAPFDTLGDTLRGTKGIIKDMFTQPDKVLKALDVIADITIDATLRSPAFPRAVMAGYPLHKGADGWMSQKQFDTFYWPPMKKVMDALIKEGLIQRLFAEGGYSTRLEAVKGFPKGTVTWHFDQTDMAKAKKVLGKQCCIQGNVPSALVITGTPKEVKEYCRKLIEVCGQGGGFLLCAGAVASNAKLDNLRAMLEAVKEYGVYKKG